jgi:hypothetical protein
MTVCHQAYALYLSGYSTKEIAHGLGLAKGRAEFCVLVIGLQLQGFEL